MSSPIKPVQNNSVNIPKIPSDDAFEYDKDHTDKPKSKQTFRKILNGVLGFTGAAVSAGVLSYAVFKIPFTYKSLNEFIRLTGSHPIPQMQKELVENIDGVPVDSFVGNYRGYENVQKAIQDSKIKVSDLDFNKNKILFDNKEEIAQLIVRLKELDENKYKNEIKLLNEINTTSQLIWGVSGPHPYNTIQGTRPNCQIMGAIQGQFLTEENVQNLKGKIQVTNFKSQGKDSRIDFRVNLNGQVVQVSFEDLVKWMSDNNESPSRSRDGALSVPVLTYAIEKSVGRYIPPPSPYPSAPPTIISGQNYCHIFTTLLSDEDLIEVLSKAPKTPVFLGTLQEDSKGLPEQIINKIRERFSNPDIKADDNENCEFKNKDDNFSLLQADFFVNDFKNQVKGIQSGTLIDTSQTVRYKSPNSRILGNHIYTVKDIKKINGEYITTIIDSHGTECDIKLDELRKRADIVISLSENIPNIGKEGLQTILWAALAVFLISKATSSLNKVILPEEDKKIAKPEISNS